MRFEIYDDFVNEYDDEFMNELESEEESEQEESGDVKAAVKEEDKERKVRFDSEVECLNTLSSDNMIHTQAEINDIKTRCLIDTGAQTSFINHTFVSSNKFKILKLETNKKWVTANGSPLIIVGKIEAKMKVEKEIFIETFIIAKDLAHEVIIGADILRRNKFIIDF